MREFLFSFSIVLLLRAIVLLIEAILDMKSGMLIEVKVRVNNSKFLSRVHCIKNF
jgi:hypothetical protein